MYSIYKLTFKDGKSYIGCTSRTPRDRLREHRALAKQTKNLEYNKSGIKCRVHDPILNHEDYEINIEYLAMYGCKHYAFLKERECIVNNKTYHPYGYNSTVCLPWKYRNDIKRND